MNNQANQDKQDDNNKEIVNSVAPFINLGLQMAITIFIFVFLGWWLDEKFELSPILILVFSLVGFIFAFYHFIKTVFKHFIKK